MGRVPAPGWNAFRRRLPPGCREANACTNRGLLRANGRLFVELAKKAGLDTGTSAGFAVVPVMVGDSLRAVHLANRLLERGINVLPIVHPAVPERAARLRFFLTAEHEPEHIKIGVETVAEEMARLEQSGFGLKMAAAIAKATRQASS